MTTEHNTTGRRLSTAGVSYGRATHRPLHILVFLAPLIIAYEIGLVVLLSSDSGVFTNKAHASLLSLFDAFGIETAAAGLLIVVVLLIWHVLNRDAWTIRWGVIGGMLVESLVLVIPLVVAGRLISQALVAQSPAGGFALEDMSLWQRIAISIGAGLYEELVFRMLLIAVLHTLFVDVLKASAWLGATIAGGGLGGDIHVVPPAGGTRRGVSMRRLAFYAAAGVYFGVLFITRGFGIAVGVHAAYDVVTVIGME